MLRMLCWLAQVEPLSKESLSVAKAVGADVPFFLHVPKGGLCAYMGGFGDEFICDMPRPELHLALVKPGRGVSTKKAYAAFDTQADAVKSRGAAEKLVLALSEKEGLIEIAALCTNDLEPVATKLLPRIGSLKKEIERLSGVQKAVMCGSGSAVFALCTSSEAAQNCMQHFADKGLWSVVAQT
jgi:4-diphosphocytidyl-2-C-methyl-D-erythritol kinase